MYDYSQSEEITRGASRLGMGFILGAAVGAGIALLLAPANGADTRHKVADAARKLGRNAKHGIDKAGAFAKSIQEDARGAIESGKETFRREKPASEYGRTV